MQRTVWIGVVLAMTIASPATAQTLRQPDLDRLARTLSYRFEILDNRPTDCPEGAGTCFRSAITIAIPAGADAVDGDLSLYTSFVNPVLRVESDAFGHEHVNGDLQRLTLRPGARLEPGRSYRIDIVAAGHFYSTAFAMPNAYLTSGDLGARTIEATRPMTDPETGLEVLPFVAPMTDERLATTSPDDRTRWLTPERAFARYAARGTATTPDVVVLPTPATVTRPAGAALDLRRGVSLTLSGVDRDALAPALAAIRGAGVRSLDRGPRLAIKLSPNMAAESYRIDANAAGIEIVAADVAGANHALRALSQQIAYEGARLRPIRIEDAPHFGYRGLHLDIGRNFHGRDQILKLVEAMADYRLNKLHLHLADDEGWRLEIAELPELAQVGGRRCHDPSEQTCLLPQLGAGPEGTSGVNGALSRDDYVAIVRAAAVRSIEVIPSIDMPGHSRAAIHAMEARHARLTAAGRPEEAARHRLVEPGDTTRYRSIQNYDDNTLNVCIEPTYRFVGTVVDAIAAMHRDAGAPLRKFHLGADETAGAWSQSPACQVMMRETRLAAPALGARFIERVSGMLAERGIAVGGWSDGLGHTDAARMPERVQTNIWGTLHTGGVAEAHVQANRGWETVLSIPDLGYLDMPHVPHPTEGGYDWASRSVDTSQVFAFMPENLPANAALVPTTMGRFAPIADATPLGDGRRVAGVQGQLWSETIRTDAGVDYMLFPRIIALAERGWRPAAWAPAYLPGATYREADPRVDRQALDAAWRDFAGRLAVHFARLDERKIGYRLSPPGVRMVNGLAEANAEYPGLAIEYRQAGAGRWQHYSTPVPAAAAMEFRTRSPDGRRASRTVVVNASSAN